MPDEMIEKEAKEYAQGNFYSEQGFIYGYERGFTEGEPKWHDLRKNPDDLPEECQNVLCLCNDIGYKYYCTGHLIYKTWFSNITSKILRVIAWCEIPKFKE